MFTDTVPAAAHLATLAEHSNTTAIGVFDHVVIKNLSVVVTTTQFTSTLSLSFDGMSIQHPVDHVQIVDVLFAD